MKRIVIDPGHGDTDSGAVSMDGLRESDVVLSIAHKVRAILANSFDVFMTRSDDTFVSLSYRSNYANQLGEIEAFISIHCNSASNTSAAGCWCAHAQHRCETCKAGNGGTSGTSRPASRAQPSVTPQPSNAIFSGRSRPAAT